MIIPIRCFTCGKVIADKYDYYIKEAEKLKLETHGGAKTKDESKLTKEEKEATAKAATEAHDTRHFDTIRTGKLLDDMGLTRYCCRRHMLSTVDMMEII
jgi:DNA-directed RNA polymerase subunit N (RpoN/RPB10)